RDGATGYLSYPPPSPYVREGGSGRERYAPDLPSGQLAMAVLVLLAAAAGAGIVAADLGAVADDGALRAAVLVIGLRGFLVGAVAAGVGVLELRLAQARLDLRTLLRFDRGDLV